MSLINIKRLFSPVSYLIFAIYGIYYATLLNSINIFSCVLPGVTNTSFVIFGELIATLLGNTLRLNRRQFFTALFWYGAIFLFINFNSSFLAYPSRIMFFVVDGIVFSQIRKLILAETSRFGSLFLGAAPVIGSTCFAFCISAVWLAKRLAVHNLVFPCLMLLNLISAVVVNKKTQLRLYQLSFGHSTNYEIARIGAISTFFLVFYFANFSMFSSPFFLPIFITLFLLGVGYFLANLATISPEFAGDFGSWIYTLVYLLLQLQCYYIIPECNLRANPLVIAEVELSKDTTLYLSSLFAPLALFAAAQLMKTPSSIKEALQYCFFYTGVYFLIYFTLCRVKNFLILVPFIYMIQSCASFFLDTIINKHEQFFKTPFFQDNFFSILDLSRIAASVCILSILKKAAVSTTPFLFKHIFILAVTSLGVAALLQYFYKC